MLPIKGLFQDTPFANQPVGYSYEAINAVIKNATFINESGTSVVSESYNALGHTQLGWANGKYGDKIICSLNSDGVSTIGILKEDGSYITKLTESALNFNENYPIEIEVQYNYKGEIVIAITDNYNTPKIINLDNIKTPFNINDIELFPSTQQPKVVTEVIESGGSLRSGAWFPFFAYKSNEGTITPYTSIGNPVFVTPSNISSGFNAYEGAEPNTITNKAIRITLNNLDLNYNKLIVGFISKIGGVLEADLYKEVEISSSSLTVVVSGSEGKTPITLTEILTPPVVYTKLATITQVNGILYGGGVTEQAPINLQKYTNLIRLKYTSTLYNLNQLETSYKVHALNNQKKSFCHEEVYAFYIRYKLKKGGFTAAELISGRPPEEGETNLISSLEGEHTAELSIDSNSKVFQIHDTAGEDGKFGYWENSDETYPNTEDFAPVNGSEDLRGKKIRHHRFPSLRTMKSLLYNSEADYGKNKLDVLGIEVESFPTLPPEILDLIEGYEILYGKRDATNSLVNGQSLLQFGQNNLFPSDADKIFTAGGNWNTALKIGSGSPVVTHNLNKNHVRLNSFDLMLDKPSIAPSYLSAQYYLTTPVTGNIIQYELNNYSFKLDYLNNATSVSFLSYVHYYKKINGFKYIPAAAQVDNYNNIGGEESAVAVIEGTSYDLPPISNLVVGTAVTQGDNVLTSESSVLANLMSYRTNVYNSYKTQQLASTGKYIKLGDTDLKIYGGDTFIGGYGFVTTAAGTVAPDIEVTAGIKMVRYFLTEGYNNMTLRHSIDSAENTKYYPEEPIASKSAWFLKLPLLTNPNRIAYNKDYSSVNDLNSIIVYNSDKEFIESDPYKIIRSKPVSAEERYSSWKQFLANDYYIIPRDKGRIVNLQGVGDNLFISCEFTTMITRGSSELATDEFKVVLGTGNIFDRPPIELQLDKNGYAGTQHKFSCLLTPLGYIFVDENKKKIFLADQQSIKDITIGLEDYFKKVLSTTGDNPYRGKGYTIGYDESLNRIILSSVEAGFTRSYSFYENAWASKHSYKAHNLLGDRRNLLAIKNGKIYKHNNPLNKGIYYDDETIHPFGIVYVINPEVEITLTNLMWKTAAFDLNKHENREVTFTSILVWNSYQSTGDINLIPFNSSQDLEWNFDNTNIRKSKNKWNFNSIRDNVINNNNPFIQGIESITSNIDTNKEFMYLKRLSDKYIVVKLLFSNQKFHNLQYEFHVLDLDFKNLVVTR